MALIPDDWTPRLASAVASAVREFSPLLRGESVVCLDIGCFPWHGFIELSALTAAELDTDPSKMDPREVASWRFYNFSAGVKSWAAAEGLGERMSETYDAAEDSNLAVTAEAFMLACARAAEAPEVLAAVSSLPRDPRFRVRVTHPDSGQVFGSPLA